MLKYFLINNILCQVLNIMVNVPKKGTRTTSLDATIKYCYSLLLALRKNLSTGITCHSMLIARGNPLKIADSQISITPQYMRQ